MGNSDTSKDAKGQYAPSQADGKNDGLASATPRTVTGHDDATLEDDDAKSPPKPQFDIREQTNRRRDDDE